MTIALAHARARAAETHVDLEKLESLWSRPSHASDPLRAAALAAIAQLSTATEAALRAAEAGDDARFAEANAAVLAGAARVEAVSAKLRARRARSAK